MSEISQDQRSQRDSLQAAQAQVASLKMQLERAVDKKVAKKGLRVSPALFLDEKVFYQIVGWVLHFFFAFFIFQKGLDHVL